MNSSQCKTSRDEQLTINNDETVTVTLTATRSNRFVKRPISKKSSRDEAKINN
jgi:hypothetical protein